MLKIPMIDQTKPILLAAFLAALIVFTGACNRQVGPRNAQNSTSPPTASAFQGDGGRFISTLQEQSTVAAEPDNGSGGNDAVSIIDTQSRSISEINVEVSDLNQPLQQFFFSINRDRHYVRVVDANARNTPTESGDIFVTLSVRTFGPGIFSDSGEIEAQSLTRLAVEYDEDIIRILEVETENAISDGDEREVILDLSRNPTAPRTVSIESEAKGAIVALEVEVLETFGIPGSENDLQPVVGGFATSLGQDKPQKFIDLAGKTEAGRVNVNVRIRGSDPSCPPPCKVASLASPEDEDTPPEDSPPPSDNTDSETDSERDPEDSGPQPQDGPVESQAPQSGSEGAEGEGAETEESLGPSAGDPPPQDEDETPEGDAPDPNKPDGDKVILENNGNMNPPVKFVDVMLIIDSSSSVLINDPSQERIDAARTYLSASLSGDQVGVIHFSNKIIPTSLIRIVQGGPLTSKGKLDIIRIIESTIAVGIFTNTSLGLDAACEELKTNGIYPRRAAILLTNDETTSGLAEEFTGPAQQCFEDQGWPIYVFGLGDSDVRLFRRIAGATGGEYTPVDDLLSLVCEVQQARAKIAGSGSRPCTRGKVNLDEFNTRTLTVPPAQVQATFSVSWEQGSDLLMKLTTPSGRIIFRSILPPDIVHDKSETIEVFSVVNPEPGEWEVVIVGADTPAEGADFVFGFSAIPIAP